MKKREAESPEIIKRRWDFKKEQIEILANNIQKLRYNVTLGLKDSDNEKVFLTALVVAIILETSERVGNEASAKNNHVGITCLRKKQISINGNKVTLEYTGKSGVEHIKSFSDEKIAKALKLAIKRSKTDDIFCTSDGFKIKADRILRYLSDFSVRSKDLRSIGCNKLMIDRLKSEEIPDDEKKRKKFFMQSLRKVSIKIGHGSGTLRKHYLIPELETNYIKNGNIIDIKERDSYEEGGEIKSDNDKFKIPYIEKTKEVSKGTLTPSRVKSEKYNNDIEFKCNYEKYFEYVPLSEIEKYIEFDREVEHKVSKKYLDELTEEIKVNGITYPITLEIYGGKGLIVEGNHRIAVAKRLGIKYIPVRVIERYRPFKGTIYEDKVKELPSSSNVTYAKAMYGVQPLDWDNSAAVHGFTKVTPKFSSGGSINRKLTYLGEVGGDKIGQKSSLEKAKSLEKQGISNEEIRQETGWFLNPHDKKWRFEISDEDFDVIQNFSEIKNMFDNDKSLTFVKKNLDEVVRHDKLFAAYPEFKTVPFIFLNEETNSFVGVYTSKKDKLQIKYNLYDERNRLTQSGGVESLRLFRNKESTQRIFDIFNALFTGSGKESDRLGDEIYRFRRNLLIHELQHVVQVREELGSGSSSEWWYDELLKRNKIDKRTITDVQHNHFKSESKKYYHNSSGEIESKDVDLRLDFSEEKRKEIIPLSLVRVNPEYITVDLEKPYFEKGGEVNNYDNFKKWFNGSKVVDEFGNQKTVYHGTNRKFNVFDSKEIGQGTGNFGHYGYGFYFSDDIREAKGYGDIILECYLNIKKPFTGTDEEFDLLKEAGFSGIENKVSLTIDFNDLHEKMKAVDSNSYEFMSIAKEHGIDNVWSIYLESNPHPHNHKIDLNDIYDILGYTDLFNQNNAVSDYAIEELNSFGIEPKLNYGYQYSQSLHWVTDLGNNSQGFTEFIKSLGYDGVIYGSEYVAFYPNQIKLANGINSEFDSNNNDIRFEYGGEIEKTTFDNFYKGTKADFKEILKQGVPKRKPDFVSDSGSKYWFTANSVIRQSNHWGQLDTCEWTLDGRFGHKTTQGICQINNFSK